MTPTLKQLKRRPALWVYTGNFDGACPAPRITMPDESMWMWVPNEWVLRNPFDWHEWCISNYEFAGWL